MKFIRGILKAIRNDKQVEVELNRDENRIIDRVEPYGITSKPKENNEVGCAFVRENQDNGVCFYVGDEQVKPTTNEGEIAIYFDKDAYIKAGQTLVIKNANGNLKTELENLWQAIADLNTALQNTETGLATIDTAFASATTVVNTVLAGVSPAGPVTGTGAGQGVLNPAAIALANDRATQAGNRATQAGMKSSEATNNKNNIRNFLSDS